MGWVALVVLAFLLGALVLAGFVSHRSEIDSTGPWTSGWIVLLIAGILTQIPGDLEPRDALIAAIGPVFPVMMYAGALRYAKRKVPRWVLVATLGLIVLRGGLASSGMIVADALVAFAVGPTLFIAAAWAVRPAARAHGSILQRLLVPGFLVLASAEFVEAMSGLLLWQGWNSEAFWLVLALPVTAVHFSASLELSSERVARTRGQRDQTAEALIETIEQLRETQRGMEERIEERTRELREQVARREAAEQVSRISEARYRNASELASDFNYAARIGSDGNVHVDWLTGAIARITGYSPSEAPDLDWRQVAHPDDVPRMGASLAKVLGGQADTVEVRIFTKDGDTRWLSARAVGIPDEATGEIVIYGACSDVTEARRARELHEKLLERVGQAQKMESLGALASGVAHDFNNLLSVILGNAAVLSEDLPSDSPLRPRSERIRNSARYAAELTSQMLTYAGDVPMTRRPLELSSLVEEMADLIGSGLSRRTRIETDLAAELPLIEGDATQIRQVLLNLVTNASEAMGEQGGSVRIHTGVLAADEEYLSDVRISAELAPAEYVYLEVSDEGPGMDDETRARLFEPFFSTKLSGRGLGLAVVFGIVRAHGGAIKLDTAPGAGTSFQVLFPLYTGAAEAVAATREEGSRDTAGGTVLVIDDDEAVCELAEIFLTGAGHRVLIATSGSEGLELHDKNRDRIDLVLLDLSMPGVDGDEVFATLRRRMPDLPIVIVSGLTSELAARKLGRPDHIAFVQKPYGPEDLIDSIREALDAGGPSEPEGLHPA